MSVMPRYQLSQIVDTEQAKAVKYLAKVLAREFKHANKASYKVDESSSIIFRIEKVGKYVINPNYCVYVTVLYEYGEIKLHRFMCTGIDNLALVLYSYKEPIGLSYTKRYMIIPRVVMSLFRGELCDV